MADTILTIDQINKLFQNLTLVMLGLADDITAWTAYKAALAAEEEWTDPIPSNPWDKVKVSYQTTGQPAWKITDDIVSFFCREVDNPYNRQRDIEIKSWDETKVAEEVSYQRTWQVSWTLYGPNSFDNARKIKSGLFLQEHHDTLAVSNVYLVTDSPSTPLRVPELFQGQWWERVDFSALFNEGVIESTEEQYVISSEVIVYKEDGAQVADVTIEADE